jgi:dihydropyrimidine dehydrogenase (NAD+) subunit PreT
MPLSVLENNIVEKHKLFGDREAIAEAQRCLYCYDPPCVKACPTTIDIPTFIRKIAHSNTVSAAKTIFSANILGDSCSKVCPVEVLCAGSCVLNHLGETPIAIGRLQRFATENTRQKLAPEELLGPKKLASGKRVALIGAGAASLAAASLLALEGHQSIIFDKRSFAGGINSYGIAPYKLKHQEALDEINWLQGLGIEFRLGIEIDETKAQEILKDFDAVFLGVGLGEDRLLTMPGSESAGVYGATALIEKIKIDPNFNLNGIERAHVIGGGNTGIDIAHELCLLGVPYVAMLYRGSESSMSGYAHEMAGARKSGLHFFPNIQVKKINSTNGKLSSFISDQSDQEIESDLMVMAVGQSGGTKVAKFFPQVELDPRSLIVVDADYRTGNPKVWSGGDAVNGGKEVVNAVAEAKIAVRSMLEHLAT